MKPRLFLCDFDGTLTHQDTMIQFFIYASGGHFFFFLKLIPLALVLPFYWFFFGRTRAKRFAYLYFLGKKKRETLHAMGRTFSKKQIPSYLRKSLYKRLKTAQKNGDTILIVSASLEWWLRPFCAAEGFELLCTLPDYDENGYFQGKFATENCKYEEKVRRIEAQYQRSAYSKVLAFGNSKGDAAMLAWADEARWFGLKKRSNIQNS